MAEASETASMTQPAATREIEEAFLEAYLMKPAFLYPTVEALRPLLGRARFVLPNGGPGGFVDVACGRVDVYLAWREALTEVFGGSNGVGFQIRSAFDSFNVTRMLAWSFFFVIFMLLMERLLQRSERRLFRWRPSNAVSA